MRAFVALCRVFALFADVTCRYYFYAYAADARCRDPRHAPLDALDALYAVARMRTMRQRRHCRC